MLKYVHVQVDCLVVDSTGRVWLPITSATEYADQHAIDCALYHLNSAGHIYAAPIPDPHTGAFFHSNTISHSSVAGE